MRLSRPTMDSLAIFCVMWLGSTTLMSRTNAQNPERTNPVTQRINAQNPVPDIPETCMTEWLRLAFPSKDFADLGTYERALRAFETPVDSDSITRTSPFLLSLVFGGEEKASNFSQCTDEGCTHPMPCKHGGFCIYADVALAGSNGSAQAKEYQCACNPGYAGLFCDNVLSICAIGNPCQNGGTCQTIGQTGYRCRCKQPFRGRYCQTYWPQELRSAGFESRGFPQLPNQGGANPPTIAGDHAQALSMFKASLKSTLDEKLAHIDALLDSKFEELDELSLRLGQNVINSFPMSCKDLQKSKENVSLPSGYYMILSHKGTFIKVYCEMERYGGGWTRIAYINPREQQRCPGTMRFQDLEVPICTRPITQSGLCSLATFHALPGEYSEVIGFVTGYRENTLDGFDALDSVGLNSFYVDGVSVTYGSPMRHLWTYGASGHRTCPCSPGVRPPSFVGSHYYCADHERVGGSWTFTPAAHAWSNTSQCRASGTCCDNTDMPWFHRQLDTSTSDQVQIRICANQASSDEDVGIDEAAIFVR